MSGGKKINKKEKKVTYKLKFEDDFFLLTTCFAPTIFFLRRIPPNIKNSIKICVDLSTIKF